MAIPRNLQTFKPCWTEEKNKPANLLTLSTNTYTLSHEQTCWKRLSVCSPTIAPGLFLIRHFHPLFITTVALQVLSGHDPKCKVDILTVLEDGQPTHGKFKGCKIVLPIPKPIQFLHHQLPSTGRLDVLLHTLHEVLKKLGWKLSRTKEERAGHRRGFQKRYIYIYNIYIWI